MQGNKHIGSDLNDFAREEMIEEPKQILIFNKSLNMPFGKLIAQLNHASLGGILKNFNKNKLDETHIQYELTMEINEPLEHWLSKKFTKVVLYVKSEEKLLDTYNKAIEAGLNAILIKDDGRTFFNGVPTYTCISIGPDLPSKLNPITGKLQVFKD